MSEHPTTPQTFPTRKLRTQLDAPTWAEVRQAYEAGAPVAFLAVHFDVAETTISLHKRTEGWARRGRGDLPPIGLTPEQAAEVVDLHNAVRAVTGQVVDAVRENDHAAVRELARTTELLCRLSRHFGISGISRAPVPFTPQRPVAEIVAERLGLALEDAR